MFGPRPLLRALLQCDTWKRLRPPGPSKATGKVQSRAMKAGTDVTGSRMSAALGSSELPGSAAGTGHRMTWGPSGAPEAVPAPPLCLCP